MSKMTAPQCDVALSQAALGLHFMSWLEDRFELPDADLPDLSREPNPGGSRRVVTEGLVVRYFVHSEHDPPSGGQGSSGALACRRCQRGGCVFYVEGRKTVVFLNTYKSTEHSRFDASHELGHLVLHKHGPPQGREAEKQANTFASAFLMPRGKCTRECAEVPFVFDAGTAQESVDNVRERSKLPPT